MTSPIRNMIDQIKKDAHAGALKKKFIFPLSNFLEELNIMSSAIHRIVLEPQETKVDITVVGINTRKIKFILNEYTIKMENQKSEIILTKKSQVQDMLDATYMMLSI